MLNNSLRYLWLFFFFGCTPHTTLEVTGYRSNLLKEYTKVFVSDAFDLQVKYVGMNDSSFTFEMNLKNKTKSEIILDCSESELVVDLCNAAFESRIKSESSMSVTVGRSDDRTVWLQFKVLGDNPMPCFLNGGNMRLSRVFVLAGGKRTDCGVFEFVPISVRLY